MGEHYFAFSHISSGLDPQTEHPDPSLFKCGLALAQVPANFPSFLSMIFTAIPAKAKANNPIVSNNNFMNRNLKYKVTNIWI